MNSPSHFACYFTLTFAVATGSFSRQDVFAAENGFAPIFDGQTLKPLAAGDGERTVAL